MFSVPLLVFFLFFIGWHLDTSTAWVRTFSYSPITSKYFQGSQFRGRGDYADGKNSFSLHAATMARYEVVSYYSYPHFCRFMRVFHLIQNKDQFHSPFNLPELTRTEKLRLATGNSIQKLNRDGWSGIGWIVLDVPASPDTVFDTLTRFRKYVFQMPFQLTEITYNLLAMHLLFQLYDPSKSLRKKKI